MRLIAAYLRERFKTTAAAALALGAAIWLVAAAWPAGKGLREFSLTLLIALTFFAFLLRQRVMDEFKDRHHDDVNYPNRPLQRGAILPRTLVYLGFSAFALEMFCALVAASISDHWISAPAYLAVVSYSVLTAFEFFVPQWLNRHFTIYFLSHQLIFVLFAFWSMTIFSTISSAKSWVGAAALLLGMASLEIMRKYEIRLNGRGEVVADTYLSVWGRTATLTVLMAIFAAAGLLFSLIKCWPLAVIGLFFALALALVRKSDLAVQATIFLGFYVLGLVVYFL